jgi:hypothetical protein
MAMKSQAVPYRVDARWALYVLFGSIGLIVVLIGIYANQADHGWAVFAGGSLAAFGAFAVGALLGLLFGVPHSAEKSTTSSTTWALIPNTSLDQISDWLTKILVGVGLTQLFEIPSKFQALASYLAPVFGGTDASKGFSLAVVISSSIVGFLASWVWTRLLLSADLAQAGADIGSQSRLAVDRQVLPTAPLPPGEHKKAVNLTASLAKRTEAGDHKVAEEVGIDSQELDRIIAEGLDTRDYDVLAKHAISKVRGSRQH